MEVKRIAKVGEKIKIIKEHRIDSGKLIHPKNSVWIVTEVVLEQSNPSGLTFLDGSNHGCFPYDYLVIEESMN